MILNNNANTNKLTFYFGNMKNNKKARKASIIAIVLIIMSIISYYFVSTNETYYKKTIAKVTSVVETKGSKEYYESGKSEQTYNQKIKAVIMNGSHKGERIRFQNNTSFSKAYDLNLKVNDEVFISITENAAKKITTVSVTDFKRDKYISYIAIMFMLLIILIGGYRGLRSLTSVIVNIVIFAVTMQLYFHGFNLTLVTLAACILFVGVSISLVSGINKKTASAMLGTIAGTIISVLIALIVIRVTNSNGIHYEEMSFLTNADYEQIFLMEILIGTLGGIMDVAISIASAINEIYDNNPNIENKVLTKSAMEIGKDIMGTMANTLVFAYISGSIPMILLLMKNGYGAFGIINFNISLEIIRALTGSIGIVISIPITLYISILLLRKIKIGEA
jgi:uncharacterized membrane protein